ncbi:PilZ domain-containing protein [Atopomonas sediminilitoris]|uniref:PilZ domain-containing protein n=1 Tax=Atopomonas sediminilitoris TaxID=2919919 RepID=UPI001F4E6431|nr:PilZ domain-containing protein [Atopomonas sediminilitoris]MCJ8170302.1 PilZ domain-containing protein [Atopomonas sediminilitoris]
MSNQRNHPRTVFRCRIRLWVPEVGELVVHTRDISDSGVYVLTDQQQLPAERGARLRGQVIDMPIEAPVVEMEVVRVEPEGLGLRFVRDE